MRIICIATVLIALTGCQKTAVEAGPNTRTDLNVELSIAKAKLATLLPNDMLVSRAELFQFDEGMGFIIAASPKDTTKNQPGFVVFFWPKNNPRDIPYETGAGSHTFRPIGSSHKFRIYYSDPSGFMKEEIQRAFCVEEKR